MEIKWVGSSNKNIGRFGYRPEAIVIHIMEGTLAGTDAWFNNPSSRVSAHYGIGKNGKIHQYVMESDTAWHAGIISVNATWSLLKPDVNPNYYTIGIEHEGFAAEPWTPAMYRASAELIHEICMRWDIPIDRRHIIGHREIYTEKTCPGSGVDLEQLIAQTGGEIARPGRYNFIPIGGEVHARMDMNIRSQFPTTQVERVRRVPAGTLLKFVGWTSNGQSVDGNPHWYKDPDGNFFWAGGTTQPIPGR